MTQHSHNRHTDSGRGGTGKSCQTPLTDEGPAPHFVSGSGPRARLLCGLTHEGVWRQSSWLGAPACTQTWGQEGPVTLGAWAQWQSLPMAGDRWLHAPGTITAADPRLSPAPGGLGPLVPGHPSVLQRAGFPQEGPGRGRKRGARGQETPAWPRWGSGRARHRASRTAGGGRSIPSLVSSASELYLAASLLQTEPA